MTDRLLVDNAAVAHAAGARGFFHRCTDRVELVVARDDRLQRAIVRVFLEDDEMLKQVKESLPLEHAAHQPFQLQ